MRARIGALRGWPPIRREAFDGEIEHGSMSVGAPDTVAAKIARSISTLGVGRFDLIYTVGPLPVGARLHAVELFGGKVIPMVREILADGPERTIGPSESQSRR